jgi:HEAT repeat protein
MLMPPVVLPKSCAPQDSPGAPDTHYLQFRHTARLRIIIQAILSLSLLLALPSLAQTPPAHLQHQLKDANPQVRGRAAFALGQMGAKEAIPQLLTLLDDPDRSVSSRAALALGMMGEPAQAALPQFMTWLQGPDPELRSVAASAIALMGPPAKSTIAQLILNLDDDHPSVRGNCARALGRMGDLAKDAVPALLSRLKDDNAVVRWSTALALGDIKIEAEAIAPVLKESLLNDRLSYVRVNAAIALTKQNRFMAEAILQLLILSKDPDELTQGLAMDHLLAVLQRIKNKDIQLSNQEIDSILSGLEKTATSIHQDETITKIEAFLRSYKKT